MATFCAGVAVFVITGGSRGIGRALALALVARGCSVCVIARDRKRLDALTSASALIRCIEADVSTEEGCQVVFSALQDAGSLSGLIHNAGVIEPIAPITAITRASWRHLFATNLEAPLFLTQLLKPLLSTTGRVLNIGSGAAYFAITGWAAYCTSKAALSMLTRCWQLECPELACASVMPGIVDTDMQAIIRSSTAMMAEKHDFFVNLKQEQRLLSSEQVAEYLVGLLLDVDLETYRSKEWDIYDGYATYPEES